MTRQTRYWVCSACEPMDTPYSAALLVVVAVVAEGAASRDCSDGLDKPVHGIAAAASEGGPARVPWPTWAVRLPMGVAGIAGQRIRSPYAANQARKAALRYTAAFWPLAGSQRGVLPWATI